MQTASDDEIFDRAASEDRVVVSADTDFGTLLSLRQETQPSVILLRRVSQYRPEKQLALLLANLPNMLDSLAQGSIIVFEERRLRIRSLPIGGPGSTE